MYIVYWTTARGKGTTQITRECFEWRSCFNRPSESLWMVPGTIDPRDD